MAGGFMDPALKAQKGRQMTHEIALVLAILASTLMLFIHGRLRMEVVGLMVLGVLALTGVVTPQEALSGFSNPAVVTVWAVFILGAGLSKTGVANLIGQHVLRLAGQGEVRLLVVIMLVSGMMSAFMNNVGVAAMLLPVVMDIARSQGLPPSKLLMPLAYSSLLGGLTTLIGTPPNILVSDALSDYGLRPFQLFDFTPLGLLILLSGITFMALAGRRLLPVRNLTKPLARGQTDLIQLYALKEQLFILKLPESSILNGKTLAQSRLGSALGFHVYAILNRSLLAPEPGMSLQAGDQLLVQGELQKLMDLRVQPLWQLLEQRPALAQLTSDEIQLVQVSLSADSSLIGKRLFEVDFRRRCGGNVLTICRNGAPLAADLQNTALQPGDALLVQGPTDHLNALDDDFIVSKVEDLKAFGIQHELFTLLIPEGSALVGQTLAQARLGDAFGLTALGIVHGETTRLMPDPTDVLMANNLLLVQAKAQDLAVIEGLRELEVDAQSPTAQMLESEAVGLVEAVLSPRTGLVGKTLRQIHFREKYGLNVLAIWREGQVFRERLRDMVLRFGDTLLLHGPRQQIRILGEEADFLVLTKGAQETPRLHKAPWAVLIMAGVLICVVLGWLPIAIAAVIGATLMVLVGCLNMEEAYRAIEWQAVFLIASMLPLGIAMEKTGASTFLAESVVNGVGGGGALAVMAGLFLITSMATQIIPTAALVVLMAPIALNTATALGVSPYALMMVVAMAASASFMSPVSHPANIMVMGPGGYRFIDYTKQGFFLTLLVFLLVMLLVPVFWPLYP